MLTLLEVELLAVKYSVTSMPRGSVFAWICQQFVLEVGCVGPVGFLDDVAAVIVVLVDLFFCNNNSLILACQFWDLLDVTSPHIKVSNDEIIRLHWLLCLWLH